MGIAYIEEYERLGADANGGAMQVAVQPPVAVQTVTYTTTAQSSAFSSKTKFVRIHTNSICSYLFGSNPTATTSKSRMAADQTEYFAVQPTDKVAFIANT